MATLKTNTLTGTSTAGSIAVTGEGNSTTTNLQQGLAKSWSFYNQQTPATPDSFNTSSITDSSAGTYFVNFSNNHASTNYAAFGMSLDIGSYYLISNVRPTFSTSQYRVDTIRANSVTTTHDADDASNATLGDLA
tara:strand:- start:23 stop:427 length:405 start_codon:yes stop_codon:yes gene_type:complete